MAGGSHTHVGPARITLHSPELATNVRRIYGYQASCDCGWRGKTWQTHREARLEQSFHRCDGGRAG